MRKTRTIQPAVDGLETRIAPGTFTLINKTTGTMYIQFVRHDPWISGQSGDTSFSAPTPASTELNGSYSIKPGATRSFSSGDSAFIARVTNSSGGVIKSSGPGVTAAPSQYTDLKTGYDIKIDDGSTTASIMIGGHYYPSMPYANLGGSTAKSLGIKLTSGFYRFPNTATVTISTPVLHTGPITFATEGHHGAASA